MNLRFKNTREKCLNYQEIKKNGNIRNPSWYYNEALKGRFIYIEKDDKDEAKSLQNQLTSMVGILNSLHQDNWDFDIIPEEDNKEAIRIVIRYPKFEITNTDNNTHIIKDLFVVLEIIANKEIKNNYGVTLPMGTRSTLSYEEWDYGYYHSHLHSNKDTDARSLFRLSEFCLGSESDIVSLTEDLIIEYCPLKFEMLLLTMDTMVKWESIEGTPYKYIRDIKDKSSYVKSIGPNLSKSYMKTYFEFLNGKKFIESKLENVDFTVNKNRYRIKRNDKFQEFIKYFVIKYLSSSYSSLLCIKNHKNEYSMYNFKNITPEEELKKISYNENGVPHFYFRDKVIRFKIEPHESKNQPTINDYKVHPKFLNYAANKIEETIYYKAVRNSSLREYYKS